MNLKQYKAISPAMYAELDAIFAKNGFKVGKLSASVDEHYGIVNLSLKLSDVNLKDANGAATNTEAEFYKANCVYIECKPEWLGQSFFSRGINYKIEGMRNTRSDKCILVSNPDGKRYIFTAEGIRGIFALKERGPQPPLSLANALRQPLVPSKRNRA